MPVTPGSLRRRRAGQCVQFGEQIRYLGRTDPLEDLQRLPQQGLPVPGVAARNGAAAKAGASSAPTPLYATYQRNWGFSPIATTVVFGVYAVAVLVTLLVFGRLSDYAGRRPVLLAALAVQVISLVMLTTAGSVPDLLAARIVQGASAAHRARAHPRRGTRGVRRLGERRALRRARPGARGGAERVR